VDNRFFQFPGSVLPSFIELEPAPDRQSLASSETPDEAAEFFKKYIFLKPSFAELVTLFGCADFEWPRNSDE